MECVGSFVVRSVLYCLCLVHLSNVVTIVAAHGQGEGCRCCLLLNLTLESFLLRDCVLENLSASPPNYRLTF